MQHTKETVVTGHFATYTLTYMLYVLQIIFFFSESFVDTITLLLICMHIGTTVTFGKIPGF